MTEVTEVIQVAPVSYKLQKYRIIPAAAAEAYPSQPSPSLALPVMFGGVLEFYIDLKLPSQFFSFLMT